MCVRACVRVSVCLYVSEKNDISFFYLSKSHLIIMQTINGVNIQCILIMMIKKTNPIGNGDVFSLN